jgi:hypothetical protein
MKYGEALLIRVHDDVVVAGCVLKNSSHKCHRSSRWMCYGDLSHLRGGAVWCGGCRGVQGVGLECGVGYPSYHVLNA